jgi:hypothetical protein
MSRRSSERSFSASWWSWQRTSCGSSTEVSSSSRNTSSRSFTRRYPTSNSRPACYTALFNRFVVGLSGHHNLCLFMLR